MPNLRDFLNQFHLVLRELKIEELKPLQGYKVSDLLEDNEKLWNDTQREVKNLVLKMLGESRNLNDIRLEPPFILGLKALLNVLGRKWADRYSQGER